MGSTVQQTMVPDNWNFNGSNPCLHHGGNYNQNQNHGPFYVNYNRTSNSNDNIGCRILAKPQANPPFGSRGSSPFLYRTVDRTALAEEKPTGHGYTILRKHNLFRLKQSLHLYYYRRDRNRVISFKRASGLISRLGQLRKCNHQQVLDRHYQPKTMFALKKVVRKECRRLQALYPPYQAA